MTISEIRIITLKVYKLKPFCSKWNNHKQLYLHLPSYSLLRLLRPKSDKTSSPERGFLTSITLQLYLAQSHCARITKHGRHHLWHIVPMMPANASASKYASIMCFEKSEVTSAEKIQLRWLWAKYLHSLLLFH